MQTLAKKAAKKAAKKVAKKVAKQIAKRVVREWRTVKRPVNLHLSDDAVECIRQVAERMGVSSLSSAVELTMREKASLLYAVPAAVLDKPNHPQVEADADLIMRQFAKSPKLTRRQIGDGVNIPTLRVKTALGRLTDLKRIKHAGGSGITTTYETIASP